MTERAHRLCPRQTIPRCGCRRNRWFAPSPCRCPSTGFGRPRRGANRSGWGFPFRTPSLTCLERERLWTSRAGAAVQLAVTSRWSDGSVRWLLADLLAPPGREGRHTWTLELNGEETAPRARLGIEESPEAILVDTGPLQFRIGCKEFGPLASVQSSAGELLGPEGSWTRLTDRKGREHSARVEHACVETAGPLCARQSA